MYQSRPIDAQSRPGSDPDSAQWPRGTLIRPVGQPRGCRRTPKSVNWTPKKQKLDPKGHHHNPKEDQRYTQRITICPKSSERCPKERPKAPRTRKGRPQNAETTKKITNCTRVAKVLRTITAAQRCFRASEKAEQNICVLLSELTKVTVLAARGEGDTHDHRSLRTKVDWPRDPRWSDVRRRTTNEEAEDIYYKE